MGEHGKAMWIRHVLVPGLTDDEAELREMSDFIKSLAACAAWRCCPYHTLGLFKVGKTWHHLQPGWHSAAQRGSGQRAEELLCIKDYPDFKK